MLGYDVTIKGQKVEDKEGKEWAKEKNKWRRMKKKEKTKDW